MPLLSWEDSYSVGVAQIDKEHRQLIDMINKAYDSAEDGNDEKALKELVSGMRDFAFTHFATETELMKRHGYPDAENHLKMHKDFTVRATISSSMPASKDWTLDAIKIFQFLADWLNNHILETDKQLGKFLNEKGIH